MQLGNSAARKTRLDLIRVRSLSNLDSHYCGEVGREPKHLVVFERLYEMFMFQTFVIFSIRLKFLESSLG